MNKNFFLCKTNQVEGNCSAKELGELLKLIAHHKRDKMKFKADKKKKIQLAMKSVRVTNQAQKVITESERKNLIKSHMRNP